MDAPALETIRAMHAAYQTATGLMLRLDMARERAWFELHRAGFTAEDVTTVAAFIKRGIARQRAGKPNPRNEGALRFRNFTALDQFEEDLAGAQLERHAKAPVVARASSPQCPPDKPKDGDCGLEARATTEDLRDLKQQLRRASGT